MREGHRFGAETDTDEYCGGGASIGAKYETELGGYKGQARPEAAGFEV